MHPENVLDRENGEPEKDVNNNVELGVRGLKGSYRTHVQKRNLNPPWVQHHPWQREQWQKKDLSRNDLVPLPCPSSRGTRSSFLLEKREARQSVDIKGLLAQRDVEITSLKVAQQTTSSTAVEESGPMTALHLENKELKWKVGDLTKRLLQLHSASNERMTFLLQKLSSPSS
ncbi:hypothetical protein HAX54_003152 [Datura stramonium]|uniref:Uncharacterized protein n=1 Tax=Datura stramonium TaxID=4076 RepID=A0ABS8T5Z4_DATST|nr:hypothetical protein [Datura stramonium]